MVVRLEADILYWNDSENGWTTSDFRCSKYPTRPEAESKMLLIAARHPEMIGKLHIKNYHENGFAQGDLF